MSPHKIPHNYPIRAPKYTFSKSKSSQEVQSSFRCNKSSVVLQETSIWYLKIWWTEEDVKIIWCLNVSRRVQVLLIPSARLPAGFVFCIFFRNDPVKLEINGQVYGQSIWTLNQKEWINTLEIGSKFKRKGGTQVLFPDFIKFSNFPKLFIKAKIKECNSTWKTNIFGKEMIISPPDADHGRHWFWNF